MTEKRTSLLLAALLSLFCLPISKAAQPVCFVKGECVGGNEAGFSQEPSVDACLIAAQNTAGATWFTYYGKIELCIAFSDCGSFDENTECQDCITGENIFF